MQVYHLQGITPNLLGGYIEKWLITLIKNEGVCYGYLKLTHALRRNYGLIINKKKVYRLCKTLKILRPQRKIKIKHPRKIAKNRSISESNQLWETDIKYGWIEGEQRFFYILSYIDVFDRCIKGYHIGLSCTALEAAITLKRAMQTEDLTVRKKTPLIRSDNGPQFIAKDFLTKHQT